MPSSRVTYIAHQIIATGHVEHTGRAYLGIAATDAQQAQAPQQGPGGFFGPGGQGSQTAPAVEGALVESVSGPAAQAGVQQGDVVTALGGAPITGEDDFSRLWPSPRVRRPLDWSGALQGRLVALGALDGLLVSLTSIGSGSLPLPLLYLLLPRLGLRRLIGSDVVVAAVLLPTAAVGHVLLGSVDVRLAANLLVGALPGVVVGSTLLARLPELVLRPALACVLLWAGGNLLGLA